MLIIFDSHPVQYRAPLYRILNEEYDLPVHVVYRSLMGVNRYFDKEFNCDIAWDSDLTQGYNYSVCSSFKEIKAFLKNMNPSAVLINGYADFFQMKAYLAALRMKLPVLIRSEATDYRNTSSVRTFIKESYLKLFYSKVAAFLYIGTRSKNHYANLSVAPEKLFFSPYAVDESIFHANSELAARTRAELSIPATDVVFLFSGKLVERKKPKLLIDALSRLLREKHFGVSVLFLGEGPLKEELAQYAKNVNVKCVFSGFKNQSELSAYYNMADILVLPSKYETWGLVVNEALIHGVPCVISDQVACGVDLVKEGQSGEIFKEGRAEELIESLKRILRYYNKEETRKECQELVKIYSMRSAAEGLKKAYKSVV